MPIAIIQGEHDSYGTLRQIEIALEECYCPVDVSVIAGAAHAPHREAASITLNAVSDFANRLLKFHGEGALGRAA